MNQCYLGGVTTDQFGSRLLHSWTGHGIFYLTTLGFGFLFADSAFGVGQPDDGDQIAEGAKAEISSARSDLLELSGRVVDLAAVLAKRHSVALPANHEPLWGFETDDGSLFTLLHTRHSIALFLDKRVREFELRITARRFPGTDIIEPTYFRAVKGGQLHEVYYYCDICSITTISPELCACCQEPVRLVVERKNVIATESDGAVSKP